MCCKSTKTLCVCSIIFFVLTIIFVGLAIGIPIYLQNYIQQEARQGVQLRQSNFFDWRQLPGDNDIKVFRDYKLYDCNNTVNIYFNSSKPECYELPPVRYYEHQYYSDADWQKLPVPDYPGRMRDAVNLVYNVDQVLVSGNQTLDRTFNVANQALFGVWYGASHQTTFSLAYAGLWSAFDGLQSTLSNQVAITALITTQPRYQSKNGFDTNPLAQNLSATQQTQLWEDVNYGFSNTDPKKQVSNILKWMQICPDYGKTQKQQMARKSDIKKHFGFDKDQMTGIQTTLCKNDLVSGYNFLRLGCGDVPNFKQRCAYLQWSTSVLTQSNDPPADSVVILDPTLAGFPEMYYFLKSKLKSYLDDNVAADIYENQFSTINFQANYEYLLAINDQIPTNSLFYYSTMQKLIDDGQKFDPKANIKKDKTLDLESFRDIMTILNLPDVQHAYVLYVYLKNLVELAVIRSDQDGYMQAVGLANFASAGLQGMMESLFKYTLPRALYGIMILTTHAQDLTDCGKIAKIYFENQVVQNVVCSEAASAIAINSIGGMYFWMQVYQLRTSQIINTLQQLTISEYMILDFLEEASPFAMALDTAMKAVKKHYYTDSQIACKITAANSEYCSDSEIGYQQFLDGAITNNLPPVITQVFPVKNTQTLAGFASLLGQKVLPPEYSYFLGQVNKTEDLKDTTVQDIYDNYPAILTNLGLIQTQFIGQNTTAIPFDTDAWRDYLRYVILEFAFNGLFVQKKVRDVLYGYNDTLIQSVVDTPVYQGGDPTQSPLLQIIEPLSTTKLSFFTGQDDSNYTQVYAKYNDSPTIAIEGIKRINNGTQSEPVLKNPWRQEVPLKGTDASKFRPLLEEGDSIWAFVSDLMLPLRFLYKDQQQKDGLQLHKYTLDQQMLYTSQKYPPNKAYYIDKYQGFGNLTSIRGAKLFASQAHFYDVPQQLDLIKSVLRDSKDGSLIVPSQENDLSYFKLEKYTGGAVEAYQRIALNVFTQHDILFNMTTAKNNFSDMIPVVYVTRSTQLTDSQLEDLFGSLKVGLKAKLALLIVFPILAGIFVILAIGFLICRRQRQKKASYTSLVG